VESLTHALMAPDGLRPLMIRYGVCIYRMPHGACGTLVDLYDTGMPVATHPSDCHARLTDIIVPRAGGESWLRAVGRRE
jgi:hypothetical protein